MALMMVKAAYWSLCTYLVFKLIQYFFVARPGFQKDEPSVRQKLLRGEPIVFIVACVVTVPAVLGSIWYLQRGYERGLQHSADCYGKMGALPHLRAVEAQFDALQLFRSVRDARHAVLLAAQSLELAPDDADRLLAERLGFHTRRYSTVRRQDDRQAMRAVAIAIERCLSVPLISL
jgi:hypothetical protein